MKNVEIWKPSKFEVRKGRLRASKNRKELTISSVLFADLIASFYDTNLPKHARGKLLDLGCGKVPLFSTYKNYITENICVDWENSLHQNPFIDFYMDLNKPLLLKNDEFDTIILSDVLEHISSPEQVWSEMFRVLKKDGKLILNVPFLYHVHEQPYDFYRYTRFALQIMAEKAGFKIIMIEEIGGLLQVLTDLFAKGVKHIPLIGKILALTSQALTSTFVKTKIGKRISQKTAQNFPLGYFLIAIKE